MIQAVQYQTTDRIQDLRRRVLAAEHAEHRVQVPTEGWSVADSDATLPERAGLAMMKLFTEMPVAITRGELIVGTRSMLVPGAHRQHAMHHVHAGLKRIKRDRMAKDPECT